MTSVPTRVPTSTRIPTRTHHVAVYDWGGSGPPVLLAHATGFHGVVWQPVATRLVAAGYHVWSFDFRGHGDSDRSPEGYSWDGFGDDAWAVTAHLGLVGDPDLLAIGHSKGGAALLLAEVARPGTYRRAWCFEPIMTPRSPLSAPAGPRAGIEESWPPRDDNPLAIGARRRRARWASPDEALASYASRPPFDTLHPDALRAYVEHGMASRPDGTVELKCLPDDEAEVYTHAPAHSLWTSLGDITTRVHVVCGEHTDSITPEYSRAIAERLPHGSLEVMPGLGHFGPLEDPDAAVTSIRCFDAESRLDR